MDIVHTLFGDVRTRGGIFFTIIAVCGILLWSYARVNRPRVFPWSWVLFNGGLAGSCFGLRYDALYVVIFGVLCLVVGIVLYFSSRS